MNNQNKLRGLNALDLKIIAMVCMFCDHLYASIVPGNAWLTYIGRIAFPIFAFQLVEGFFHTHDYKAYLKRMLIMAIITEIPFNLVAGGGMIYPFHQNVLFTFTIGLIVLKAIHKYRNQGPFKFTLATIGFTLLGSLIATLTMVDYFGYGILMIVLFYLAHESKYAKVITLIGMYLINAVIMEGLIVMIPVNMFGLNLMLEIPQQAFALFALIPIFLYNGQQGPHNKYIQWFAYWFYPGHLLLLGILAKFF